MSSPSHLSFPLSLTRVQFSRPPPPAAPPCESSSSPLSSMSGWQRGSASGEWRERQPTALAAIDPPLSSPTSAVQLPLDALLPWRGEAVGVGVERICRHQCGCNSALWSCEERYVADTGAHLQRHEQSGYIHCHPACPEWATLQASQAKRRRKSGATGGQRRKPHNSAQPVSSTALAPSSAIDTQERAAAAAPSLPSTPSFLHRVWGEVMTGDSEEHSDEDSDDQATHSSAAAATAATVPSSSTPAQPSHAPSSSPSPAVAAGSFRPRVSARVRLHLCHSVTEVSLQSSASRTSRHGPARARCIAVDVSLGEWRCTHSGR